MTSFGDRLRLERKRLQLTQTELANLGGLQKNAQIDYERDVKTPTAEYLLKIMHAGADIGYLFYGVRNDLLESPMVTQLLQVLSDLPPAQQAMGYAVLSMFRQSSQADDASNDADAIWRAAQLFAQFLKLDHAGKTIVEAAASGAMKLVAP